jgi:Secretion system C-terminal sorting domain
MLVDMNGKEVYEEAMNNYSGKMEKDINAAGLSKGTYVVNVEAAGERATTTIVLQ